MAEIIRIDPENVDLDKIKKVASLIRAGKIVALPTETVYGLTCNLDDAASVERLYEVKQRPENKFFTIHVARKGDVDVYVKDIPAKVQKLVEDFWPGPLTLICNSRSADSTIGIRCPDNAVTSLILEASFAKVGMPSANISGQSPCLTALEVEAVLGDKIDLIVDTMTACSGVSSTVLDVTKDHFKVIRQGAIKVNEEQEVVKTLKVVFVCTGNTCRSVMAKYYFENKWNKQQTDASNVCFESCAIMGLEGMPASNGAIEVLAKQGIKASDHFSKVITQDLIEDADIVVAMTRMHRQEVLRVFEDQAKILLLSELIDEAGFVDLPDPVGAPIAEYQNVFNKIVEAEKKLFDMIRSI